jgi:hypothetical protein
MTCDKKKASLVPQYYVHNHVLDCERDFEDCVEEEAWTLKRTILRVPNILQKHIGEKRYDARRNL